MPWKLCSLHTHKQAVLAHLNVNPPDISTNFHVYKEVKKVVNHQLTQQRSNIKKEVSILSDMGWLSLPHTNNSTHYQLKSSVKKNKSIYELAVSLVEDTKCVVTVPLCARLALLVCPISVIVYSKLTLLLM